ncbi:MAG: indolepyruvate ferredoxin oxidoreductase subunit alpha, partial [Rhodospirillales bacterium]|nr:indolepyruvate ferredoxin oxidoreductase subunit alpha [Rhodospirillales bacterium]
DYGEGASVIQERTHATALKSSMPLIDPRYDMPTIVDLTEHAFALSEACNLPVLFSLRIRACHMTGSFICKENRPALRKSLNAPLSPNFDYTKIVLPPSTYAQEKAKVEERLPAAQAYIQSNRLNEVFPAQSVRHGIIMQGGTYGVVMRALARLGHADAFGKADVPLLVLNVVHPLVPKEITDFLEDKDSVLIIEEGHPAFIEEQIRAILQQADMSCTVYGKNVIPTTGEYITPVVRAGIATYLAALSDTPLAAKTKRLNNAIEKRVRLARENKPRQPLPPRPPSFCTGCPERPVFTALKLIQRARGPLHISMDIGCSTFATLPPFNMGNTVLGYGLSLASSGAIAGALGQPAIAVMGDGAFWHNGLTTGAINARWQGMDAVLVILDNGYASATGQQHLPSTGATPTGEPVQISIEKTLRGIGVEWIRHVDSYDVKATRAALEEALDEPAKGLRVIMSGNECMLAKKRRGNALKAKALGAGTSVRNARYGVDAEICSGDHSCIRLSGCPSLTLKAATDPLKDGPTAMVDTNCAACNLCGENAHAAQLCPSFYKARGIVNASALQLWMAAMNMKLLKLMGAS